MHRTIFALSYYIPLSSPCPGLSAAAQEIPQSPALWSNCCARGQKRTYKSKYTIKYVHTGISSQESALSLLRPISSQPHSLLPLLPLLACTICKQKIAAPVVDNSACQKKQLLSCAAPQSSTSTSNGQRIRKKNVKNQNFNLAYISSRHMLGRAVFMDVCFVVFLFCSSICVCVCLQVQGPLRDCPRAGRFRASLLLHTTCVRSCCTWRASRVAA